jgi:hypothetical protein
MADEPKPPPPRFIEQWSAITPGDFGLQAGFRGPRRGEVFFRPILGWLTATSRNEDTGDVTNGIHAVVMGFVSAPFPAPLIAGYLGVFPKTMAPHEAWEYSKRWRTETVQDDEEPAEAEEEALVPEDRLGEASAQALSNVLPFPLPAKP